MGVRQRGDPDLCQVIQYLETGDLPADQKRARELVLSGPQYLLVEGVLYFVEHDKTLRLVPPTEDRKPLFEEVHSGKFGGHLRDSKVHGALAKRYWWPGMQQQVIQWC